MGGTDMGEDAPAGRRWPLGFGPTARLAALGFVVLAFCMYWLGTGRWAAFEYQCALWGGWFLAAALLAATVPSALRRTNTMPGRLATAAVGPALFLLIFLSLYIGAQVVCWRLEKGQEARRQHTGPHATGDTYTFDRVLGYRPRENAESGATLTVDGELVFDYTYHTDAYARRVVPAQADEGRSYERALLVFGGSYAFGEGVSDGESLPNQLALRLPDTRIYNYGFSGYGSGQALARLESGTLPEQVKEKQVAALYIFIPNHVRRVIGSFTVIPWSRHSPYYPINPGEEAPVRTGSFQSDRARLTRFYDFLQGDYVLKYTHIDFPLRVRAEHLAHTAKLLGAAKDRFQEQFDSPDFTVVLFPASPQDEFDPRELAPYAEKRGLRVLDYAQLFAGDSSAHFYLPHDPHPRPETYEILAGELAQSGLFSPRQP